MTCEGYDLANAKAIVSEACNAVGITSMPDITPTPASYYYAILLIDVSGFV